MRIEPHDVTKEDMELDRGTIREIVIDELHDSNYDDFLAGKPVKRLDDETIEGLLQQVYRHIEAQALEVYHTTESWALKAWCYGHILRDVVASENTDGLVTELMSPLFDWQAGQDFDPIAYYKGRLDIEGKSYMTKQGYVQAACRFVARAGRNRNYTDEEIIDYLQYARKRFPNDHTYFHECVRLLQFLRRLPGADKRRELPIKMPKAPREWYQPTFSREEVETIIWSCLFENIPASLLVRLAVASIYGGRRSELAQLRSSDFHLDGDSSTIRIRTLKGGQRKPQPIPPELVPLFAIPIAPMADYTLQRQLKRICKKAEIKFPYRGGFHCFRRRVATDVSEVEPSDINTSNFMRWATPRGLSMLARYKQTPVEETDRRILEKHPYVKVWEEACPFIIQHNSDYREQAQYCN